MPPTSPLGWDGEYSLAYAHEESQDVGHDDNDEIDPDQDEYKTESIEDTNAMYDDEDDDGNLFIL